MTQQEWKAQRTKAAANLELLKMKRRSGLVSLDDVAQAEAILAALVNFPVDTLQEPPSTRRPNLQAESAVELPAMPVSEFARMLEELTLEKAEYHKQMCILSNHLKDVPDDMNAKPLVDRIDSFYEKRTAVAVKINFLKANGRLPDDDVPEADTEGLKLKFMENLPADKFELSKLLNNTLSNLSKARARLDTSKDPVKRVHYSQKVAKLEAEVALVRSRISGAS